MTPDHRQALIDKLFALPEERLVEVDDFIDFLVMRERERSLTRAAAGMSEPSFAAVWDNPEDDIYNAR